LATRGSRRASASRSTVTRATAAPESAALVVRRRHLDSGSNDLGFARTADGYFPIISAYDQRTLLGGQFLPKLRVAYAERVVETVRQRLRGSLRRTVEGSVIKLRVRY
jgi:hypothetical protein